MDLPWKSHESNSFVTNVGLITSRNEGRDNIMSAEWTHHISYSPGIIAVSISKDNNTTAKNIAKTKVFGVSIVAEDQNVIASKAGDYEGYLVDKISALRDLGFSFIRGKETGVYLVEGSVLQLECKLVNIIDSGSHNLFIGEVVSAKLVDKKPLIMHGGKFWRFGEQIHKSAQNELDRINQIFDKYKLN
ncbi:MAG: flavin reductase family protein [Nanoarchaeota archaeon]